MRRVHTTRTLSSVLVGGALVAVMTLSAVGASAQAGQSQQEAELRAARESLLRRLAEIEAQLGETGAEGARAIHERQALAEELLARRMGEQQRALAETRRAAEQALREAQERGRSRYGVAPRLRYSGRPLSRSGSVDWIMAQADEIGLTDEQMERLRDARREHRRAEIERDAAIEVAELDLAELVENEVEADLAAVQQALETISRLRVEERMADLRLTQESHAILTPEQREQLHERRRTGLRGMLLRRDRDDGPAVFRFDGDDPAEVFEFRGGDFVFDGGRFEFAPFGRFEFDPFDDFELHGFEALEFEHDLPFGGLFELLHEHERDEDRDEESPEQETDPDHQGVERSSAMANGRLVIPVAT